MSEQAEAKRDGATLVRNSGRGYQKGDAILGPFTVDYKEYSKTFGLSSQVWAKISTDAMANGDYHPALKVVLGTPPNRIRLWVVGEDIMTDYLRLRADEEKRIEDE